MAKKPVLTDVAAGTRSARAPLLSQEITRRVLLQSKGALAKATRQTAKEMVQDSYAEIAAVMCAADYDPVVALIEEARASESPEFRVMVAKVLMGYKYQPLPTVTEEVKEEDRDTRSILLRMV